MEYKVTSGHKTDGFFRLHFRGLYSGLCYWRSLESKVEKSFKVLVMLSPGFCKAFAL